MTSDRGSIWPPIRSSDSRGMSGGSAVLSAEMSIGCLAGNKATGSMPGRLATTAKAPKAMASALPPAMRAAPALKGRRAVSSHRTGPR